MIILKGVIICLILSVFGVDVASAAIPDIGTLADGFTSAAGGITSGTGGQVSAGTILSAYLLYLSAQ